MVFISSAEVFFFCGGGRLRCKNSQERSIVARVHMILTQVGLKLVQVNKSDSIDAEDFSTHSLRMLMC